MQYKQFEFMFEVYTSSADLSIDDAALLQQAKDVALKAYAPYSHFMVGAAAVLSNGEFMLGTNQENASYPVGICAERTLLASAATQFPEAHVITMAISYYNYGKDSHNYQPVSPCGMCRQALVEYETRFKHPVKLILGGKEGEVYVIPQSHFLLPLHFNKSFL